MTPRKAKETQEALDASIAFSLPIPEVTELWGGEADFHWLLAHRLFTGHNRAMSQAQPGHEETTARGEAGPAVI